MEEGAENHGARKRCKPPRGADAGGSCNNGGEWQTPYFLCDYGLGELSIGSTTPAGLEAVFTTSPPAGKM